jgi:MFS family permease
VVLIALALGYYVGGALADRWQRVSSLAFLLFPAAVGLLFLPDYAPALLGSIVERHPPDAPVPALWQKLDPVIGSALIFLLPCLVLATLSPYMIRLSTTSLKQVGRSAGFIIAAGTVGSIAGVFVSGFVLIDHMKVSSIFRLMGLLTLLLGFLCLVLERWLGLQRKADGRVSKLEWNQEESA